MTGDCVANIQYAGGSTRTQVMEIKMLPPDVVMTVTGKNIEENLENLKKSGFYRYCDRTYLKSKQGNPQGYRQVGHHPSFWTCHELQAVPY